MCPGPVWLRPVLQNTAKCSQLLRTKVIAGDLDEPVSANTGVVRCPGPADLPNDTGRVAAGELLPADAQNPGLQLALRLASEIDDRPIADVDPVVIKPGFRIASTWSRRAMVTSVTSTRTVNSAAAAVRDEPKVVGPTSGICNDDTHWTFQVITCRTRWRAGPGEALGLPRSRPLDPVWDGLVKD